MDSEQDGKYPYAGTVGAVVAMGGKHVNKEVHVSFLKFFTFLWSMIIEL